jgi:hypothetical protein
LDPAIAQRLDKRISHRPLAGGHHDIKLLLTDQALDPRQICRFT